MYNKTRIDKYNKTLTYVGKLEFTGGWQFTVENLDQLVSSAPQNYLLWYDLYIKTNVR